MAAPTPPPRYSPAHLGWRLLALLYDLLPALAIWFAVAALVLLGRAGVPATPNSPAAWLELALLWLATGAYAVLSWRRGGQTLGARAWRLRLIAADGTTPDWRRLWLRYLLATLSWLPFGLGFFWSLLDGRKRSWHDLGTDTVLVREK